MPTRIMVIEDDPLIIQLLRYQLGGAGYEVVAMPNGVRALERIMLEQPDVVLLDVMMPQMSGWEVCRQIRACSAVPIIMLTAKGADDDVVTGLTAGADDYMTKPFSLAQLLARVEAVLRRAAPQRLAAPAASLRRAEAQPRAAGTRAPTTRRVPGGQPDPHLVYAAEVYPAQPGVLPAHEPAGQPAQRPTRERFAEPPAARLGRQLYEARLLKGSTLHQAADECGVRWDFLQALEQEHFGYVPRPALRHALRAYSTYLGLDVYQLTGRPAPRRLRLAGGTPSFAALALLVMMVLIAGMLLL